MKNEQTCIRLLADKVQIESCRTKLLQHDEELRSMSNVLGLAGNEVRLKILYLLNGEEELCPCDLSDILGMSIPAVSQHLRKLKDGGLVKIRRVAQTVFYSLTDKRESFVLMPVFNQINNYRINERSIK